MTTVGLILFRLLQIYLYVLIARMILSWVPLLAPNFKPTGIIAVIFEFIYTLTDPPIKLGQKFIPPLQLGGIGLDLAFMVVFLAVILAQRLVLMIFF